MNNLESIRNNFNRYLVSPLNQFGFGGFLFDVTRDTTQVLNADITDHFVEDNTAVQDHIAVRPEEITLRNFVGENVFRPSNDVLAATQNVIQKLTLIESYLPRISQSYQQALDLGNIATADFEFDTAVDTAQNIWELTRNLNPGANAQQQSYLYFKALFQQKVLVSVQTPYGFFRNMAIVNITAGQPEDSEFITDFSIKLKEIRQIGTEVIAFDQAQFQSRAAQQRQAEENKGRTNGGQTSLGIDFFSNVATASGSLFGGAVNGNNG